MEYATNRKKIQKRSIILGIMFVLVLTILVLGFVQLFIDTKNQSVIDSKKTEKVYDNKKNAGKSIDVDKFVATIKDKVKFESTLEKLDDSVAEGMVQTANGTDLRIYLGNGTYADELIIMTGKNERDAKVNQQNVKKHFQDMKNSFENYLPQEAKKIDKAVIIRCGSYLIACITNDSQNAKEVITKALAE